MRKFRTFKCIECNHVDDRLVQDDVNTIDCRECAGVTELQISAPRYFGNSTGRSPSAVN